jgi:hypothetical protein
LGGEDESRPIPAGNFHAAQIHVTAAVVDDLQPEIVAARGRDFVEGQGRRWRQDFRGGKFQTENRIKISHCGRIDFNFIDGVADTGAKAHACS